MKILQEGEKNGKGKDVQGEEEHKGGRVKGGAGGINAGKEKNE